MPKVNTRNSINCTARIERYYGIILLQDTKAIGNLIVPLENATINRQPTDLSIIAVDPVMKRHMVYSMSALLICSEYTPWMAFMRATAALERALPGLFSEYSLIRRSVSSYLCPKQHN